MPDFIVILFKCLFTFQILLLAHQEEERRKQEELEALRRREEEKRAEEEAAAAAAAAAAALAQQQEEEQRRREQEAQRQQELQRQRQQQQEALRRLQQQQQQQQLAQMKVAPHMMRLQNKWYKTYIMADKYPAFQLPSSSKWGQQSANTINQNQNTLSLAEIQKLEEERERQVREEVRRQTVSQKRRAICLNLIVFDKCDFHPH